MGGAPSVAGISPEWGTEGFHVLQTQHGSPGDAAGLEPYFDFIVAINDRRLDKDDDTLRTILKQQINQTVTLYVYSTKYKRIRSVTVVPSESWGGPGLLGVSIRFCSFAEAHEAVWHVTNVLPGSPAQVAGLISNSDYIIGSDVTLSAGNDLLTLIEVSDKQPIKLYVYNSSTDSTREVILVPDSSWPGEGSIGCQICSGYLHQIPIPMGDNVHTAIPRVQENEFAQNSEKNHCPPGGFDSVFTEIKGEDGHQQEKATPQERTDDGQKLGLIDTIGSVSTQQSFPIFHPDQDLATLKIKPSQDVQPQIPLQPVQDSASNSFYNPTAVHGTNPHEMPQRNTASLSFEAKVPQFSQGGVSSTAPFCPIPQPASNFAHQHPTHTATSGQSYPNQPPPHLPVWTPTQLAGTPGRPALSTTSPTRNLTSEGPSFGQTVTSQQVFPASQSAAGPNESCPAWMTISVPPGLRKP